MITATLHLPSERKNATFSRHSFEKLKRQFQSRVTIHRGNSILFDSSFGKQFTMHSHDGGEDLRITIEGRDEMKAACTYIDFFNHGSGI